jgi:hypothetical protein
MSLSRKVLVSFVLAVLSLFLWFLESPGLPTGLAALVLAIWGLKDIDRSGGRLRGGILGGLTLLLVVAGMTWFLVLGPFASEKIASDMVNNNLKQLAFAMFAYSDIHGTFPAQASCRANGQTLLSWRVLLLPYLGSAALYNEFRLDEPWDSPHNIKLVPKMPLVYASWRKDLPQRRGLTFFQVFAGRGTAFDGTRGLRPRADFRDGLGSTLLIVEAADPVPWTKPEDLSYADEEPLPRLGPQFHGVFADGSVHLFQDPAEKTIRSAITRNKGD